MAKYVCLVERPFQHWSQVYNMLETSTSCFPNLLPQTSSPTLLKLANSPWGIFVQLEVLNEWKINPSLAEKDSKVGLILGDTCCHLVWSLHVQNIL